MPVNVKEITIAHSPDSDDAFMFYALAKGKLDTKGLKVNQVLKDIQTLNREALAGTYEVTAISFGAYPKLKDKYFLMPCGSSMGDNYGPIVVAKPGITRDDLQKLTIAIPGRETTAYLALRLWNPGLNVVEVPFEQIIDKVVSGQVDAGLLIHEGQLTYKDNGLEKLVDLGVWWHEETGLPLPLGGNAIRKDLGKEAITEITALFKAAVMYALEHREDALAYAMSFARDMKKDVADKYVGMYVNELTVDSGDKGREAVVKLFAEAHAKGILSELIVPEFV